MVFQLSIFAHLSCTSPAVAMPNQPSPATAASVVLDLKVAPLTATSADASFGSRLRRFSLPSGGVSRVPACCACLQGN